MIAVTFIFWGSVFFIFWTYFGYLITLKLLSVVASKRVDSRDYAPDVTLVITAYNEEKRMSEKIENSLSLEYASDKLSIIIVSDGSTDRTDEIVRSYEQRGVRLLRIPERRGKHYGQRHGMELARTDIVVFSDATTFLERDAIQKIVRSFSDSTIGVVSGEDRILHEDDNRSGEGIYVRYEMKLRALEAMVGSLVGASGCFFAIRKHLGSTWVDNMSSDFFMPIVAYMSGFRTVSEPEAIGYYSVLTDPDREFERKVRTVLHGIEVLFRFKRILNPLRFGFYSIQMISHKLMRWIVPFALLVLLLASAVLSVESFFFELVLATQLLFYALALVGRIFESLQKFTLFRLPVFFVMVNLSIVMAWISYFKGQKQIIWEATER